MDSEVETGKSKVSERDQPIAMRGQPIAMMGTVQTEDVGTPKEYARDLLRVVWRDRKWEGRWRITRLIRVSTASVEYQRR